MLKTYEAIIQDGQIQWLTEQPDIQSGRVFITFLEDQSTVIDHSNDPDFIRQLSESEKLEIFKELQTRYRTNKLDYFLNEFETDSLPLEEIDQEVEIVRSQNHGSSSENLCG